VKFGFVARHRGIWPIEFACEALGISRSGFYAWRRRPLSRRARTDAAILATIRASFAMSDATYGVRRMLDDVRDAGHVCGRDRVGRLMRAAAHAIAPNLLDRQFTAMAPNQKWVADFTYIWTSEGWLYVAVVLDLFSRRIVGWSMQPTMTAELVTDAFIMAVWRRGPAARLLHHSDQGSQGGFNRSLQHPRRGGCDDETDATAFRSFGTTEVALAGTTTRWTPGGPAAVLGRHCPRALSRDRGRRRPRVLGGGHALVSASWRDAAFPLGALGAPAFRSLSLVC